MNSLRDRARHAAR